MENIQKIKLGIVGNQGVGKTSLILRMAEKKFVDVVTCGVTIDFRQIKNFEVDGQIYNIQIYDVAGLAKNNDLAISFIKDAQGLILAFDFADSEYYQNGNIIKQPFDQQIKEWLDKIINNTAKNIPIFITGCKRDKLKDEKILETINEIVLKIIAERNTNDNNINVIEKPGSKKSKTKKIFFETSAKEGTGVEELFQLLVKHAAKLPKNKNITLTNNSAKKKQNKSIDCC